MPCAEGRDSSSEVAKLRRDIKNSFEQHARAVSCGDVPLVKIPILGRVVRLFGDWIGICSFCGCLAKILPTSRFRGDICCMRCDFAMLVGKDAAAAMDAALPKEPPPTCRFCLKVQPENCTGAKWRKVNAPPDAVGKNADVPPPLRVVYYCPSHYRGWMPNAHQTMTNAEIVSHLVHKARPMHGANGVKESAGASGDASRADGDAAGTTTDPGTSTAKKAPPPQPSKHKAALLRQINKKTRKGRPGHSTTR